MKYLLYMLLALFVGAAIAVIIVTGGSQCPRKIYLRDENGNIITPQSTAPYSPRQTCGLSDCHNYEKIVKGYHFTQGWGEKVKKEDKAIYPWLLSYGNYGGRWCPTAPDFHWVSPLKISSPLQSDLTSFTFAVNCGVCHPGGNTMEHDRQGHRYDVYLKKHPELAKDPTNGDYYQSKWDKTGVMEADCLLCHLKGYNFKIRWSQIKNLNFKWASTAASHLGEVIGTVKNGQKPIVRYNPRLFDEKNMVSLTITKKVDDRICIECHKFSDWKKRGVTWNAQHDVHLKNDIHCVDCHTAGMLALDSRIKGKERHQFAKGDDPGIWVRNDLDNTLSCKICHNRGLKRIYMWGHKLILGKCFEKLDCTVCHIPKHYTQAALIQDSTVFNKDAKIPQAKRIWTYYGQEAGYYNYYFDLLSFLPDQPPHFWSPELCVYKDKIYPINKTHSIWIGIKEPDKKGIMQISMHRLLVMWQKHFEEGKYKTLDLIKDDNGDGHPEVNTAQEREAIIKAVKAFLADEKIDLGKKQIVLVVDNLLYIDSNHYKILPKTSYENSPYASAFKLTHDVAPKEKALGYETCEECHSPHSKFFYRPVLVRLWDENGNALWEPQYKTLGYTKEQVEHLTHLKISTFKEYLHTLFNAWDSFWRGE